MADGTRISWSDSTWNPVTGCTKVSAGCERCYIASTPPFRMSRRRFVHPNGSPDQVGATTGVQLHPDRLEIPVRWRRRRRIFVCSLADLFHHDVPDDYIARVWAAMANARQHTFQVLTKRPARMRALLTSDAFRDAVHRAGAKVGEGPLRNVWIGTTAENQGWLDSRLHYLLDTPAAVRWLSLEPLLGPIILPASCLPNINWVVAGGESGPKARPAHPDWFRCLRDQCATSKIPFHFKQHGAYRSTGGAPGTHRVRTDGTWAVEDGTRVGANEEIVQRASAKANGRELDGRIHDEYPLGHA